MYNKSNEMLVRKLEHWSFPKHFLPISFVIWELIHERGADYGFEQTFDIRISDTEANISGNSEV